MRVADGIAIDAVVGLDVGERGVAIFRVFPVFEALDRRRGLETFEVAELSTLFKVAERIERHGDPAGCGTYSRPRSPRI